MRSEAIRNAGTQAVRISLDATVLVLVAFFSWVMINIFTPPIEKLFVKPVESLGFREVLCHEGNLLAEARLDKTLYWNGMYAEYRELTLRFSDGEAVRWARFNGTMDPVEAMSSPRDPINRPAGVSKFYIFMLDACGREFYAHTEHTSPLTRMRVKMNFGPFTVGSSLD